METTTLRTAYESTGPFATALVDVAHDSEDGAHQHELRVRAACESLSDQGADETVVEAVRTRLAERLERSSPVARLVVSTPSGVVLDEVVSTQVDSPVATYDALPDLAEWIARRDAAVRFVLALVDHEGGDVAVHDSDVPEPVEESEPGGEERFVHKVPVGGWSALRYQHTTENVWARNADAVVEEVESHVRAGTPLVLLAGDPRSRGLVRDGLDATGAEVVELDSGTRAEDGGDNALRQAVRAALLDVVVRRRVAVTHELAQEIGRGGAGASGVEPVLDALAKGQVGTLVLDPTALADVRVDPADHAGLALPTGMPKGDLRADLVLVAAAVLTDAQVTTARAGSLGGEPVAALLRWEERPGNEAPAQGV